MDLSCFVEKRFVRKLFGLKLFCRGKTISCLDLSYFISCSGLNCLDLICFVVDLRNSGLLHRHDFDDSQKTVFRTCATT